MKRPAWGLQSKFIGAIALFSWALNRGQLWRLVPIARSFVLEHHDHGLIVADRNQLLKLLEDEQRLPIDAKVTKVEEDK